VAGVTRPDATPVRWGSWVERHAPVALLVWASWLPRANAVLGRVPALRAACRKRGLDLVVVDVGEPLEDAAAALGSRGVPWLHDRHGSVLKHYRLVNVPRIVMLGPGDRVLGRLEPTAAAVAAWRGR